MKKLGTYKLYKVTVKGGLEVYVVARNAESAGRITKGFLDKKSWRFSRDRVPVTIELLAEHTCNPSIETWLLIEGAMPYEDPQFGQKEITKEAKLKLTSDKGIIIEDQTGSESKVVRTTEIVIDEDSEEWDEES